MPKLSKAVSATVYLNINLNAKENNFWYNAKQLCKQLFLVIPYYNLLQVEITYQLSKHNTSLISHLAGHTSSHIKNSRQFTEMIGSVHVESDDILVSFDVSSLFTNVPVGKAVFVIRERLREGETLRQDPSLPRTDYRYTGIVPKSPPTSALEGTSMSRRKVRRWALLWCQPLHAVLWEAGTGDGTDQTQAVEEVCWWYFLHPQ